jgi:hypothetical protein
MGEISQDSDQKVHVKVVKPDFSLYYGLFTYLEFGVIDAEELKKHLMSIKELLIAKYGKTDFRVKYLALCLMKTETHEFDSEAKDWVRYVLHAECEPEDPHTDLLEELREKMETTSV